KGEGAMTTLKKTIKCNPLITQKKFNGTK
ncbi:MAG: hypothetical protein ACI86H_002661, partial [bacterium]